MRLNKGGGKSLRLKMKRDGYTQKEEEEEG
jgi:hypothetical protein